MHFMAVNAFLHSFEKFYQKESEAPLSACICDLMSLQNFKVMPDSLRLIPVIHSNHKSFNQFVRFCPFLSSYFLKIFHNFAPLQTFETEAGLVAP